MITKAELETRVSQKTGKEYTVLVLYFKNGYTKTVFLEQAEIYMLKGQ